MGRGLAEAGKRGRPGQKLSRMGQWARVGRAGLSGRTARKGPLGDPSGDQTGGSFLVTNKLVGGRPPGPRRDCAVFWKLSENEGRGKKKFLNKSD